jgi:hypothetical protein
MNVADADFPRAEEAEDAKPRPVGQRLEQRFHRDQPSIHIRLDKYTTPDQYSR